MGEVKAGKSRCYDEPGEWSAGVWGKCRQEGAVVMISLGNGVQGWGGSDGRKEPLL